VLIKLCGDAESALIGSYPEPLDLAQQQRLVRQWAKAHAADRVTIGARQEKEATRRQQLIKLQMKLLVASAVATTQFIDGGVIDAESAVGGDEFVIDEQIRHDTTVGGGTTAPSGSLRCESSLKEIYFRPVSAELDLWPSRKPNLLAGRANNVFERSMKLRENAEPWIFYEGPPTANGKPGLHHVWARVYKDLFCRYQTMRGRYVARRAGWDTHGLPVEVQVEKQLGISGKKQIEEKIVCGVHAPVSRIGVDVRR